MVWRIILRVEQMLIIFSGIKRLSQIQIKIFIFFLLIFFFFSSRSGKGWFSIIWSRFMFKKIQSFLHLRSIWIRLFVFCLNLSKYSRIQKFEFKFRELLSHLLINGRKVFIAHFAAKLLISFQIFFIYLSIDYIEDFSQILELPAIPRFKVVHILYSIVRSKILFYVRFYFLIVYLQYEPLHLVKLPVWLRYILYIMSVFRSWVWICHTSFKIKPKIKN